MKNFEPLVPQVAYYIDIICHTIVINLNTYILQVMLCRIFAVAHVSLLLVAQNYIGSNTFVSIVAKPLFAEIIPDY